MRKPMKIGAKCDPVKHLMHGVPMSYAVPRARTFIMATRVNVKWITARSLFPPAHGPLLV
jgi:hypothetical protein